MQKTKNRWLGILLLLLLPFSLNAEEEVVELETYTAEDEIEDDYVDSITGSNWSQ